MIRLIKLSLLCMVVAGASFLFLGKDGLLRGVLGGRVEVDQDDFRRGALDVANEGRAILRLKPLRENPLMEEWLSIRARTAAKTGGGALSEMLSKLRESHPHIGISSAHVVYAANPSALQAKLGQEWQGVGDEWGAFTHLSTHVFHSAANRSLACVALLVQELPRFSPALLNEGVELVYSVCRLCEHGHAGRIARMNRAVVLTCPRCERRYELLAMNRRGHYCHVGEMFSNVSLSLDSGPFDSRLEEMFAVWKAVLDRCRYAEDIVGVKGAKDIWQTSAETWKVANGDCEDTSILLADWLISRGFDARVALGTLAGHGGHAWCVVRLGGEQYILESTEAKPDPKRPPLVTRIGQYYRPEILFDPDYVYFRTGKGWTPLYYSKSAWVKVRFSSGGQARVTETRSAPASARAF